MQADAGARSPTCWTRCGSRRSGGRRRTGWPRLRDCARRLRAQAGRDGGRARRRRCIRRRWRAPSRGAAGDALAVYDGGHTTSGATTSRRCMTSRTRFHDPGMSQLGFGLPYALALQRSIRTAGGQHHRRRLVRLHPAGAGHRAALRAAGGHDHPQQRRLGHHPRRASKRSSISSWAPRWRTPTTRPSRAASAASARRDRSRTTSRRRCSARWLPACPRCSTAAPASCRIPPCRRSAA